MNYGGGHVEMLTKASFSWLILFYTKLFVIQVTTCLYRPPKFVAEMGHIMAFNIFN
jgi:hypothetical protein